MMTITKEQSNTFYRMKAIAIFTVFFAHMPIIYDSGQTVTMIYKYLGQTGVPTFLILAGYFDKGSRSPLLKKINNILVPLLIWGTISFLFQYIGGNISDKSYYNVFISWSKWVYGCGTWLYFVPVLIWCKIFVAFSKNRFIPFLLLLASIVSIAFTSWSIIPYGSIFTPYVNPLNFFIYFYIGYLIRDYDINFLSRKYTYWAIFVILIVFLLQHNMPSYFTLWCIPYSLAIFVLLYHVSANINVGISIGKLSFVIYLSHLIFTYLIERKILYFLLDTPLEFLKIPVAFFIVIGIVWLIKISLENAKTQNLIVFLGFR